MAEPAANASAILVEAHQYYEYALIHALIRTHPNPELLFKEWRNLSAITSANLASSMIARGIKGHCSEEIAKAFDGIDGTILEAISNHKLRK